MSGKVNAKEQAKTFGELNDEEKLKMCQVVREFPTMNSITKSTLKEMFDWLFDAATETVQEEENE
ncbi:hypothetical protein [Atopococcus tabaci]|uniref:hypothetical protein n=1 Tax=Atopococcus tabaci TaxID=269774 RepID=UPI002409BEAC|nr:hypothetical protein [Atopococcus tabaci]